MIRRAARGLAFEPALDPGTQGPRVPRGSRAGISSHGRPHLCWTSVPVAWVDHRKRQISEVGCGKMRATAATCSGKTHKMGLSHGARSSANFVLIQMTRGRHPEDVGDSIGR